VVTYGGNATFTPVSAVAVPITYTDQAAFDYRPSDFPELMDLAFLTDVPGGVRSELMQWVQSGQTPAPRTASVFALLEYLDTYDLNAAPPSTDVNFFTYWAMVRFKEFLEGVVDARARMLKALPVEQRKIVFCFSDPVELEKLSLNNSAIQPAVEELGNRWVGYFDEIVRKACCAN